MKLTYLLLPIAFVLSACFPVEEKQEPIIVDEDITAFAAPVDAPAWAIRDA